MPVTLFSIKTFNNIIYIENESRHIDNFDVEINMKEIKKPKGKYSLLLTYLYRKLALHMITYYLIFYVNNRSNKFLNFNAVFLDTQYFI